jgi:hypothetical protein
VFPVFREVTPEQEQEAREKILKFIKDRGVETAAILVFGSFRNMSRLGGMAGRFFLGPLVPFLPHDVEQYIWVLEKEENIDWLLEQLENGNTEKGEQPDSTEK